MYKSYKFRAYPNDKQKQITNQTFGNTRFVYNYYLSKQQQDNNITIKECISDYNKLKKTYQFLSKENQYLMISTIYKLNNNIKKYKSNDFGYPKYKSKYNRNSYTLKENIIVNLKKQILISPNLGELKIRGYKKLDKINGTLINITISKEKNDKYYISLLYDTPTPTRTIPRVTVGIDLGVRKLLTLSDGTAYDNNKYIDKYEKRIKRKQRELSRKEKGSKNYNKCKKELAILYSKLSNARRFYIHKITKNITDEYDIITCEKLKTKEMIIEGKDNKLSSKINDATFSEIIRQLQYKSKYKGKQFYQINTYYPSSQICSRCDNQDRRYKDLTRREYKCTKCNQELDRDLNASINIMFEGLKLYIKNYARV